MRGVTSNPAIFESAIAGTDDYRPAIRALAKAAIQDYGIKVIGIEDGFRGLVENRVRPFRYNDLSGLLALGGTILGTSRGGLQAMGLATQVKHRLLGVALNDVGPVLDTEGLSNIMVFLGRRPASRTHAEAAAALAKYSQWPACRSNRKCSSALRPLRFASSRSE